MRKAESTKKKPGPHRPPLSIEQILAWADEFYERTGRWPKGDSGVIPDSSDTKWKDVNAALHKQLRGLKVKSSLAQLLAAERGVVNHKRLPPLTPEQILAWADAHHERTGRWPHEGSGPVLNTYGETWRGISRALSVGARGLKGGRTLTQFLIKERKIKAKHSIKKVLAWADAHFARHGRWPNAESGTIPESPDDTWRGVEACLRFGLRGLPAGLTLARFLKKYRGKPNHMDHGPLTIKQILAWADEHYRRTGQWPKVNSGPIPGTDDETWLSVYHSLYHGRRGLPYRRRLSQLLAEQRGAPTSGYIDPNLRWRRG